MVELSRKHRAIKYREAIRGKSFPEDLPGRSQQLTGPQKSLNLKTNKTNVIWPKTKVSYETIMNDNILSFIFV